MQRAGQLHKRAHTHSHHSFPTSHQSWSFFFQYKVIPSLPLSASLNNHAVGFDYLNKVVRVVNLKSKWKKGKVLAGPTKSPSGFWRVSAQITFYWACFVHRWYEDGSVTSPLVSPNAKSSAVLAKVVPCFEEKVEIWAFKWLIHRERFIHYTLRKYLGFLSSCFRETEIKPGLSVNLSI